MEGVPQEHRVLGRESPSPGCAWMTGSLEVAWEDGRATQTLDAGGMTSQSVLGVGREGFSSRLFADHHTYPAYSNVILHLCLQQAAKAAHSLRVCHAGNPTRQELSCGNSTFVHHQ